MHGTAGDHRVGTSDVDVLEGTEGVGRELELTSRLWPGGIDFEDLAGTDVADPTAGKKRERAGLRRNRPSILEATERERAIAHGVAYRIEAITRKDDE